MVSYSQRSDLFQLEGTCTGHLARAFRRGLGGGNAVAEHNVDDISAILDVSMQEYDTMNVSWESGVAKFYVHRVDRAGYAGSCARFEVARRRSTRSR